MKIKKLFYWYIILIFVFSTNKIFSMEIAKKNNDKVSYECPMHPEVQSTNKDRCSVCGMELVKKEKKKRIFYTCVMHPNVKKETEGNCLICGMDLVPEKPYK